MRTITTEMMRAMRDDASIHDPDFVVCYERKNDISEYSIFWNLGEDVGSDDDPVLTTLHAEFAEQMMGCLREKHPRSLRINELIENIAKNKKCTETVAEDWIMSRIEEEIVGDDIIDGEPQMELVADQRDRILQLIADLFEELD